MILRAVGAALIAAAAGPALGAEGGAMRGGEHADFSRLVMVIEPTTEWSLETGDGVATIRFPRRQLRFDTSAVFDRMPRERIAAVSASADGADTVVTVALACACRVSTSFVGARYLALDIGDATAAAKPPAVVAESARDRAVREERAVATAEQILIRQIERAAGQGLVELSDPAAPAMPEAPEAGERVAETGPLPRSVAHPPAETPATDPIALLSDHDHIEAVTVFDRDGRAARAAAAGAPEDACLADDRLDIEAWAGPAPFPTQEAGLRRRLVGEFDAPDPAVVAELARLYVRFGFGAEARALLAAFGPPAPGDAGLLVDMSHVVEGLPAAADGPLAYRGACPGRYGLWLALGGRAPLFHDPAHFATVRAAFEELPPDLRGLLGPDLVVRLVDAGRPGEARVILDVTIRAGGGETPAIRLASARLAAVETDPASALPLLADLAGSDAPVATEALARLTGLALAERLPVPDTTLTDLRTAALANRGTPAEATFRTLVVRALAQRGALAEAVAEARAGMADLPDAAPEFAALIVASVAEANPAITGGAAYAETALGAEDVLAQTPPRDAARRTVARTLLSLGLADAAIGLVAPAVALDDPAARLIAADASVRLADPAAALALLGDLDGADAGLIRARALALQGDNAGAQAALAAAGLDAEAARLAWAAGDWAGTLATAPDPDRTALAAYMAARAGTAIPPPDADPARGFQAPLPPLDRPTLRAARDLLATAPDVNGVVSGVLANP